MAWWKAEIEIYIPSGNEFRISLEVTQTGLVICQMLKDRHSKKTYLLCPPQRTQSSCCRPSVQGFTSLDLLTRSLSLGASSLVVPRPLVSAPPSTNLKASLWYDGAAVMIVHALFRLPYLSSHRIQTAERRQKHTHVFSSEVDGVWLRTLHIPLTSVIMCHIYLNVEWGLNKSHWCSGHQGMVLRSLWLFLWRW